MRRKRHASHENHERWLVSYADFITLLFAFFVVMFATGRTDKAKAQQFSEAAKEAFDQNKLTAAVSALIGGTRKDSGHGIADLRKPGGATDNKDGQQTSGSAVADLLPSLKQLSEDLQQEIRERKVEISLEPRGLVVSLKQAAFFPSGTDTIPESAHSSLARIAAVVKKLPNPVRLEGHTDAVPINNGRFRNNWELSAARSIAVMEIFELQFGIPRARMAISGYADVAPVASNETEPGRAQNRRVDILVMSPQATVMQPGQLSSGGLSSAVPLPQVGGTPEASARQP